MGGLAQRLQAERLRFPGMLPREIVVWVAWLQLHESEYSGWQYNVRIGKGDDPGPTYPDNIRQMAIANSQKRLDALAFQGPQPFIFEVKDRAQLSAVGQLLGYSHLYRMDNPLQPEPVLVLVTNRTTADLGVVTHASNIRLDLVDADYSALRG